MEDREGESRFFDRQAFMGLACFGVFFGSSSCLLRELLRAGTRQCLDASIAGGLIGLALGGLLYVGLRVWEDMSVAHREG